MREPAHGLPELAEAMLAEGILRETDWCGDVRGSLRHGLARWVDQQLGGTSLQRIYLGITWTNHLGPGMSPELWLEAGGARDPKQPVGLLSLLGPVMEGEDETRDVFVGRTVQALNTHSPGLGYQVLGLVQDALAPVVHAGGPGAGYGQLRPLDELQARWAELAIQKGMAHLSFEEIAREVGMEPPRHGVTLKEYLALIPEAACLCDQRLRTHLIPRALKGPVPPALRPILEAARDLDAVRQIPRETLQCDTPLFLKSTVSLATDFCGIPKETPFCIRWRRGDPIARVFGDYNRVIQSRDSGTNVLWLRAWRSNDAHGLRRAVRDWKLILRAALKGCRLAELLHSEEDPQ